MAVPPLRGGKGLNVAFLFGCENAHMEFPTKTVLDGVTLGVHEGDRMGIVGRNGDGKSTLLSVLAGATELNDGRITRRGGIRMGLLGQADALADEDTVGHAVVGDTPEYVWASDARIRDIIANLIADIPWDAQVKTLSGGQRRRADLARLLIGDWDVLMLDEPTNHLDMRAIAWLAVHLKRHWPHGQGALLVVTHDRWFLDEVATSMWEVHDGIVEPFEGGYSAYVLQRVERERVAQVTEQKRRNLMRKELAWLSRGARARATKPKFHVALAQELISDVPPMRNTLELRAMAMQRLGKQVIELANVTERFAAPAAPALASANASVLANASAVSAGPAPEPAPASPAAPEPPTRTVTVLDGIDWIIGPGDRVGILGENGAGKTTLLRILSGDLTPSSGRVKIGQTVRFAVLSQRLDELAEVEKYRVTEVLSRYRTRVVVDGKEVTPAKLLERLGFSSKHLYSRICDLSGGQKRRLQLLLILLDEPNVLILDEPGNDLDTDMLAVLEDLLDSWAGTLIMVSHDRYLMERVTDDQFALIDGKLRHCPGGVDEYLRLLDARDAARLAAPDAARGAARTSAAAARRAAGTSAAAARGAARTDPAAVSAGQGPSSADAAAGFAPKLSNVELRQLKKQFASAERKMETAAGKVEAKRAEMAAADPTDFMLLGRLQDELQELIDAQDALELEWLELSEKLGE